MILREQNILFILRATQHGGTENVVLQLIEGLNNKVNRIVIAGGEGFRVDKLKPYNIVYYTLPDIEKKDPLSVVCIMKRIWRIVKKENITIVHTHHRMAAFYIEILGIYRHCYFVNTCHNTFSNKVYLTRFAYKNASLIACGETVGKNLNNVFGIKKYTVIRNSVKPFQKEICVFDEFKESREKGSFLIGNIGRITEQKGMEYYVRAIPGVLKEHPEAVFYIVGSGEDEDKIRKLALELGNSLKILGYRDDIQNIMAQLDLIVISSLWEGLPLIPIEAFSAGKTIVATCIDGTREVVRDKENGLLVEPGNVKELKDKICWIIDHTNERKTMEHKAVETYNREFSYKKFLKNYLDYYESL